MGLGDDADQSIDDDHEDEPRRDAIVAGRWIAGGDKAELLGRDHLVHAPEAVELVDDEGHEQEGEDDDEDALNEVREDRRRQPAQQAVGQKKDGHDADGQPGTDGLSGDGAGGLGGAEEHDAGVESEVEQPPEGIHQPDGAAEAVLVEIGGGEVAQAPEDGGDDPVEGGGEEVEPLVPDASQAELVGGAGDGDRLIGVGARPEGVHDHEGGAELAASHEIIAEAADPARHPQPGDHDADEVEQQCGYVQRVKTVHSTSSNRPGPERPHETYPCG